MRSMLRFLVRRYYSSSSTPLPSNVYTNPPQAATPSLSSPTSLTAKQHHILDRALRVDQAGEIAANWIYRGQFFILGNDPVTGPLIKDMWQQEKKHLAVMNKLQLQYQVRPTVLIDIAKVAGFGLGALTALIGKEAAMACTEAVETVIGEHYDDQLREIEPLLSAHPGLPLLKEIIKEFRDDELEHLDIAVINNAQKVPAHALLSSAIGLGCKAAIDLCKRF